MSMEMKYKQQSVLARLMGFDELLPQQPDQKRQRILSENYLHRVASIGVGWKHSEQYSFQMSVEEQKDCPDIFEILETLKRNRHRSKSVERKEVHSSFFSSSSSTSSNSGDWKRGQIISPWNKNLCVELKEKKKLDNGIGPARPRSRFSKQITRKMVKGMSSMMTKIPRPEIISHETFAEESVLSAPSSPILCNKKNQFYHSDGSCVISEAKEQLSERWKRTKMFQQVEFAGRNRTATRLSKKISLDHKPDCCSVNNPISPMNFKPVRGPKTRIGHGAFQYDKYMKALESISLVNVKSRKLVSKQKDSSECENFDSSCKKFTSIPHLESENNCSLETNYINQNDLENKHEDSCGRSPAAPKSAEQNDCALKDAWVKQEGHSNGNKDENISEQNPVTDMMDVVETEAVKGSSLNHEQQSESMERNFLEEDEDSSLQVLDTSNQQAMSIEVYEKKSVSSHHSGHYLVSLEEADQRSPVSVLESLFNHDTSSSPHCFQSVNASLHGLNMQLELLKSEGSDAYSEGSGMMVSSDEEGSVGDPEEKEDQMRLFRVEESRDFSYLVDVLVEAGFHNKSKHMDFDEWHPLSASVFETLEKKYGKQISWKRSERMLLFDRINLGLLDILHPSMGVSIWMKPVARGFNFRWGPKLIEEELWSFLARQEKEASSGSQNIFGKDDRWLELGDDIQVISLEVENSLIDELVADVVSIQSFEG